MPNPVNISNITPPRVPLTDERTGLISREWYRFFLNLFQLVGGGSNQISLTDIQYAPPPIRVEDIPGPAGDVVPSPGTSEVSASINDVRQELETLPSPATAELAANLNDVRQELQTLPTFISAAPSTAAVSGSPPVVQTANFSVSSTDLWLINNKSGSSCTVTLPSAAIAAGRILYFLNYQAQTLVSASSNVVPRVGGSAGTAILAAVAGDTATLVSDGTNWIMTQYTPNNVLLLE
jgi:hypothetical protein